MGLAVDRRSGVPVVNIVNERPFVQGRREFCCLHSLEQLKLFLL
jgi:hypothetical protein